MRSRRRSWKNMKRSSIFDEEMKGFGHAKSWIFINFIGELQCRRVFRLFHKSIETSQKMHAKMAPKRLQNRAWRCLGPPFLTFWEAFGRCQILMSFGDRKKWAKNRKIATLARQRENPAPILGRGELFWGLEELPKACKTWNWAKSSRNLELGVWQELQFLSSTHCSPSRTGAADSSRAAHTARPQLLRTFACSPVMVADCWSIVATENLESKNNGSRQRRKQQKNKLYRIQRVRKRGSSYRGVLM